MEKINFNLFFRAGPNVGRRPRQPKKTATPQPSSQRFLLENNCIRAQESLESVATKKVDVVERSLKVILSQENMGKTKALQANACTNKNTKGPLSNYAKLKILSLGFPYAIRSHCSDLISQAFNRSDPTSLKMCASEARHTSEDLERCFFLGSMEKMWWCPISFSYDVHDFL